MCRLYVAWIVVGIMRLSVVAIGMDVEAQINFMQMFERVGVPLNLDQKSTQFGVGDYVGDWREVERGCEEETFSYFLPNHKQAADELVEILLAQPSRNGFLSLCSYYRDRVNRQMWTYAVTSAALQRKDMRGIRAPPVWEVMPDLFISTNIQKLARNEAVLPPEERRALKINDYSEGGSEGLEKNIKKFTVIDSSFSGRNLNPENKIWYFREDLGLASHHWHWHLIYSREAPVEGRGSRDRKGELFYYMHHNLVARYDAERLSNGLARVKSLDLTTGPIIEEGYFPKLTSENSGLIWGSRQDNTQLRGISRNIGDMEFNLEIEDLRRWKDRILDAIDTQFVLAKNGSKIPIDNVQGIDILAGIIENGGKGSLNERFYGNLHNMGHVFLAFAHDPDNRHNENMGCMGDTVTAAKDPVFYRWHKFINNLFDKHKRTLTPYTEKELIWEGIEVTKISVFTKKFDKNILVTNWKDHELELHRGLDLRRSHGDVQGSVRARVTHLNHEPFTYSIHVLSNAKSTVKATVRIFMAPRNDEHGQRLPFSQQRTLFFEMDKSMVELQAGQNRIKRSSTQSSVTVPWQSNFRDLETLIFERDGNPASLNPTRGCGWPHHLLLPRGNSAGIVFDLFVILTDATDDGFTRMSPRTVLKDTSSYCGLVDEKYPDKKPMGFPFDRISRKISKAGIEARNLDEFMPANSNMAAIQITIIHQDGVVYRENGTLKSCS